MLNNIISYFVFVCCDNTLLSGDEFVISTGVQTVEKPLIGEHLQRASLNHWIELPALAAAASSD